MLNVKLYVPVTTSFQNVAKPVRFRFTEATAGNVQALLNVPWSSLCSRGNIGRFRRRRYEMAETARVTEAPRLGYVEATHVFCGDPGMLV